MRYLRVFKYLLVIMAAGAALAFIEHQRASEYDYLSERTHARSQPALKGESLQELAQVLLELYPEGAQSNLLMGTALAEKGQLKEARLHLEKAFDLQTLGAIPYPPDNPPRQKRIELGRLVFFDPILGGEKNVACGTCHHPDFAFADFRQFSAGTSGVGLGPDRVVSHSAITGNESGQSSHLGFQFLDGRVNGLEAQAIKPITSRVEMRGDAYPGTNEEAAAAALDSVIARLRSIPEYVQLFQRKRRWWKGLPSLIRRPTAGPLGPTSAS